MMIPRPEEATTDSPFVSLLGVPRPRLGGIAAFWLAAIVSISAQGDVVASPGQLTAAIYTNVIVPAEPWSIHVVKIPRSNPAFEIRSLHAGAGALGMSPLSEQIAATNLMPGNVVAAINGGFYRRNKTYAGAPRGLQIAEGEVLSAPGSGPCVWIDAGREPHIENVASQFQIIWSGGQSNRVGLNEERNDNTVVLYTPAIGGSTRTTNGLEFILERQGASRWLPLRMGRSLSAKVKSVQSGGNTALTADVMVLSIGTTLAGRFQKVQAGDTLQISTASSPSLSVARNALAGGPILVHNGKRQKIHASPDDAYESSSMIEPHPRSAIGWNADWYFLVVVDGRQQELSDGMTLEELANFLVKLGCEEALNLDGGGSSTLWYDGSVRNSPCDGYERPIANSLVVVQKPAKPAAQPSVHVEAASEGKSR